MENLEQKKQEPQISMEGDKTEWKERHTQTDRNRQE